MDNKRDKIIRKIGTSIGIIFNKEEQRMFDIKVNDTVKIAIEKESVVEEQ